ncbi:MAG TPA: aspartyl protease family protein [Planctomycetaceae bacterium]
MGVDTMGCISVQAKVENLADLYLANRGLMDPSKIRSLEVADALVDTGATLLCLPLRFAEQLGLNPGRKRRVRTAGGLVDVAIYDAVKLTIQGRECTVDVAAIPDDCPVLIGQIPLEILDFIVDPMGQRLIGNPEHGGEQMIEIFSYFPHS